MSQLTADQVIEAMRESDDDYENELADNEVVLRAMAAGDEDELLTLLSGVMLDGWIDENNPNRLNGYTDWVGYLPSSGRAVWVTNGDPVWFDASSLDDAVAQAKTGLED